MNLRQITIHDDINNFVQTKELPHPEFPFAFISQRLYDNGEINDYQIADLKNAIKNDNSTTAKLIKYGINLDSNDLNFIDNIYDFITLCYVYSDKENSIALTDTLINITKNKFNQRSFYYKNFNPYQTQINEFIRDLSSIQSGLNLASIIEESVDNKDKLLKIIVKIIASYINNKPKTTISQAKKLYVELFKTNDNDEQLISFAVNLLAYLNFEQQAVRTYIYNYNKLYNINNVLVIKKMFRYKDFIDHKHLISIFDEKANHIIQLIDEHNEKIKEMPKNASVIINREKTIDYGILFNFNKIDINNITAKQIEDTLNTLYIENNNKYLPKYKFQKIARIVNNYSFIEVIANINPTYFEKLIDEYHINLKKLKNKLPEKEFYTASTYETHLNISQNAVLAYLKTLDKNTKINKNIMDITIEHIKSSSGPIMTIKEIIGKLIKIINDENELTKLYEQLLISTLNDTKYGYITESNFTKFIEKTAGLIIKIFSKDEIIEFCKKNPKYLDYFTKYDAFITNNAENVYGIIEQNFINEISDMNENNIHTFVPKISKLPYGNNHKCKKIFIDTICNNKFSIRATIPAINKILHVFTNDELKYLIQSLNESVGETNND